MFSIFARTRRDGSASALADGLKDRIRRHLGLGDDDGVTISEIACPDPACPGTETAILVMRPHRRTVALKVAKPLGDIDEADIAALALPD